MLKLKLIFILFLASTAYGGYDFYGHGPILPAPIHGPLVAPAPIYAPAPILAPAPIIKTIAPASIIKTIPAATSYASITKYISHPIPIVKTIVAPQPILKSYIPAPYAFGHGYH